MLMFNEDKLLDLFNQHKSLKYLCFLCRLSAVIRSFLHQVLCVFCLFPDNRSFPPESNGPSCLISEWVARWMLLTVVVAAAERCLLRLLSEDTCRSSHASFRHEQAQILAVTQHRGNTCHIHTNRLRVAAWQRAAAHSDSERRSYRTQCGRFGQPLISLNIAKETGNMSITYFLFNQVNAKLHSERMTTAQLCRIISSSLPAFYQLKKFGHSGFRSKCNRDIAASPLRMKSMPTWIKRHVKETGPIKIHNFPMIRRV